MRHVPGIRNALSLDRERERRILRTLAIIKEYRDGFKMREIAEKYDIGVPTVAKYIKQAGLNRNQKLAEKAPYVVAMYKEGVPLKVICRAHTIDRKSVWSIVKKEGIPLRKNKNANS